MLQPGDILGVYRVIAPLGSGGMGEVYSADDTRLHRRVALKVLSPALAGDATAATRLLREARAAAALDHPNICAVFDVGTSEHGAFIAMQYVDGETLARRLERGRLDTAATVVVAGQIAAALAAAHARGIVHRDIKPQNVMLAAGLQVKVLDFGLAKQAAVSPRDATITNLTEAATIAGTAGYMSPEQLRGEPLDARSDVFSFGIVLYELLTGVHPFAAPSSAETMSAVLTREPSFELTAVSPELTRIVRRCLEKDRERRYQSMRDVAIDLENAVRDVRPPIATKRARRRAIWIGVAATAAAAVVTPMLLSRKAPRPVVVPASAFTQLTNFPDSVSAPSLSPDGRMVTFIRGGDWFLSTGQIWIKLLPDGEARQLTHDARPKYGPVFTPDGSRVTYSVLPTETGGFDTWSVPVLGGDPTPLLPNASGLTWRDDRHVIFAEIEEAHGLHMGIVTGTIDRSNERRVYFPAHERAMAHFAQISPDGTWLLVVEMNGAGIWQPCRLVPFDGSNAGRPVGPPGACSAVAWSPDGREMYFSVAGSGGSHLWRQRFPDGTPEAITGGTATSEQGVAVDRDGRTLVTAVGQTQSSLWLHTTDGDRVLPLEGRVRAATVSADGARAYCLVERDSERTPTGITVIDLATGKTDRLLTGYTIDGFDESDAAQAIVFQTPVSGAAHELWIAPLDRRSPPRQLLSGADTPKFVGQGTIFFRSLSDRQNFVERIGTNGSGRQRVLATPIIDLITISPDGAWVIASAPSDSGPVPARILAFPTGAGAPMRLCADICNLRWSPDARHLYASGTDNIGDYTSIVSLPAGRMLPAAPTDGTPALPLWNALPGVRRIRGAEIRPTNDPTRYVFRKEETLSNLFRIALR